MKLYNYHTGEGPPVLMIHGLYASHHYLSYVYELLKDYHVIAPDLLGFGASPKPKDSDYSSETQAQLVIELLQELKVTEPITIVGHSMGGIIGLYIADLLGNENVASVVMCNTPIYSSRERLLEAFSNHNEDPEEVLYGRRAKIVIESNAIVSPFVRVISKPISKVWHRSYPPGTITDVVQCNWASYSGSLKNVLERQDDLNELMIKYADKLTIISGKSDRFRSKNAEKSFVQKHPQTQLHEFDSGHHTPIEFPHEVAEIIQKSITQVAKS